VERPIILDCDRLGNQLLRNPVSGVAVDPIRFMQDLPPFRRTPRRVHGPPPLSTHGLAGDRRLRIYRSVTSYERSSESLRAERIKLKRDRCPRS
jgi:hypothetical protein